MLALRTTLQCVLRLLAPRQLALALAIVALFRERGAAAQTATPSFPIEQHVLPNGLRVVLAPDQQLSGVTLDVEYDVGSRDEPAGMNGIAHLVEHLMFDGSKHVPARQTARLLEGAGATGINGQTSVDRTVLFETVPREALERALWLESDRMGFSVDTLTDDLI